MDHNALFIIRNKKLFTYLYSGDIKLEYTSPERPVDSESPSWNPVHFAKTEENRNTANTVFLPEETPHLPTASTDTALPKYAAGKWINGGMFYLIIRVNERPSVIGRCQSQPRKLA